MDLHIATINHSLKTGLSKALMIISGFDPRVSQRDAQALNKPDVRQDLEKTF